MWNSVPLLDHSTLNRNKIIKAARVISDLLWEAERSETSAVLSVIIWQFQRLREPTFLMEFRLFK